MQRFVTILLLCTICVFGLTKGGLLSTDVITFDCSGNLKVFPNTVMESHISLSKEAQVYNFFMDTVKTRLKSRCPSMTDRYFKRMYSFSMESFLYHNSEEEMEDTCFNLNAPLTSWMNLKGKSLEMPSSCNLATVSLGKPCLFSTQVLDTTFQVAVDSCPSGSDGKLNYLPYVSISCSGDKCNELFKPCNSDSDCSAGFNCVELSQRLFSSKYFEILLDNIGMAMIPRTETCSSPADMLSTILKQITEKNFSFGSAKLEGFKFCMTNLTNVVDSYYDMSTCNGYRADNPNSCTQEGYKCVADYQGQASCSCSSPYEMDYSTNQCILASCNGISANDASVCSGHGRCSNYGYTEHCTCETGYSGTYCDSQSPYCPNGCNNGGVCIDDNVCFCVNGYSGETCEIPSDYSCDKVKSDPTVCSGHGSCEYQAQNYGTCKCSKGYAGFYCDTVVVSCFGYDNTTRAGCWGRGDCTSENICNCDPGWYGINCSEDGAEDDFFCNGLSFKHPEVCSRRGKCSRVYGSVGQCECSSHFPGYTGDNCDKIQECYGKSTFDPTVCSGKGECNSDGKCKCREGFYGVECEHSFTCDKECDCIDRDGTEKGVCKGLNIFPSKNQVILDGSKIETCRTYQDVAFIGQDCDVGLNLQKMKLKASIWDGVLSNGESAVSSTRKKGQEQTNSEVQDSKYVVLFQRDCNENLKVLPDLGFLNIKMPYLSELVQRVSQVLSTARSCDNTWTNAMHRAMFQLYHLNGYLFRSSVHQSSLSLGKWAEHSTIDTVLNYALAYSKNLRIQTPESCRYETYDTQGCSMTYSGFKYVFDSDIKLHATYKRCKNFPDGLPSISILCEGKLCDMVRNIKLCSTSADCPSIDDSKQRCVDLMEEFGSEYSDPVDLILQTVYSDRTDKSLTAQDFARLVSMVQNNTLQSTPDGAKVCLPDFDVIKENYEIWQTQAYTSNGDKIIVPDLEEYSGPVDVVVEDPSMLFASSRQSTSFSVSWTASTSSVDEYVVDIIAQGFSKRLKTTATSISVTGLTPSTTYEVSVTAVRGQTSSGSVTITVTTTQNDDVPTITNLVAKLVSADRFTVSWEGPMAATQYTVKVQGPNKDIELSSEETTIVVRGLSPLSSYRVTILALKDRDTLTTSDTLVVTTSAGSSGSTGGNTPGAVGNIEIVFKLTLNVPAGGSIRLSLPSLYTIIGTSRSITDNSTQRVIVTDEQGNKISLRSVSISGNDISCVVDTQVPSGIISTTIVNVRNPSTPSESSSVSVETRTADNMQLESLSATLPAIAEEDVSEASRGTTFSLVLLALLCLSLLA